MGVRDYFSRWDTSNVTAKQNKIGNIGILVLHSEIVKASNMQSNSQLERHNKTFLNFWKKKSHKVSWKMLTFSSFWSIFSPETDGSGEEIWAARRCSGPYILIAWCKNSWKEGINPLNGFIQILFLPIHGVWCKMMMMNLSSLHEMDISKLTFPLLMHFMSCKISGKWMISDQ